MNKRQRKKAAKKQAELEITKKVDSLCAYLDGVNRVIENFASGFADLLERFVKALTPVLETLEKWEKTRSFLAIAYNRSKEIKMIEYKEKK